MDPTYQELARESEQARYGVTPPPSAAEELATHGASLGDVVSDALGAWGEPDITEVGLLRMFQERGYSEDVAAWIVREASMRRTAEAATGEVPVL